MNLAVLTYACWRLLLFRIFVARAKISVVYVDKSATLPLSARCAPSYDDSSA